MSVRRAESERAHGGEVVGRGASSTMDPPPRLERLPARTLPGGLRVAEARSLRARLLGLAGLDRVPPGHALLLARCRSVHTFGMRVPLDIVFVGPDGAAVRVVRGLRPRRLAACRGAWAVVEAAAGEADTVVRALGEPRRRPLSSGG
jgi:uncharacterized membrane protein (UPF0127 family)